MAWEVDGSPTIIEIAPSFFGVGGIRSFEVDEPVTDSMIFIAEDPVWVRSVLT